MRPGVVESAVSAPPVGAVERRLAYRVGGDGRRIVEDRRLVVADLGIVEGPAIAAAQRRLAVAEDVEGEAETGSEVLLLCRAHLVPEGRSLIVVGGARAVEDQAVDVVDADDNPRSRWRLSTDRRCCRPGCMGR